MWDVVGCCSHALLFADPLNTLHCRNLCRVRFLLDTFGREKLGEGAGVLGGWGTAVAGLAVVGDAAGHWRLHQLGWVAR